MRRFALAVVALAALGCQGPADEEPQLDPAPQADAPEATVPARAPGAVLPRAPIALTADLSPFERAVAERIRAVTETMVEVEELDKDEVVGWGSGVLISPRGDVLTAGHVVAHEGFHFRIVLPDGQRRDATVAFHDSARDVALLRAPGAPTPFARPRARPAEPGDWAVCAGWGGDVPGESVPMRTVGVVAQRAYSWTVKEYATGTRYPVPKSTRTFPGMLRLDCATAPGMSGGPVVDLDGELLGVVVGSNGVASPIDTIRHLLPAAPLAPAPPSPAAPPPTPAPARGPDGFASRDAALAPVLASPGIERSLVELEAPVGLMSHRMTDLRRFTAVLVSEDGLAVAPSVRVASWSDPERNLPVEEITVVAHPDARCTEIVAIEGELALIRLSGLPHGDETGPRPVGSPGAAAVGEIVAAVSQSGGVRSAGFLTGADRHPGNVAPDGPRWGCGMVHAHFHDTYPPVVVGTALAHDAGWSGYGTLIVDREGRPIAVQTAWRGPGLAFAIPWTDVLARFDPWLSPG